MQKMDQESALIAGKGINNSVELGNPGYNHFTVIHKYNFSDPTTGVLNSTIKNNEAQLAITLNGILQNLCRENT